MNQYTFIAVYLFTGFALITEKERHELDHMFSKFITPSQWRTKIERLSSERDMAIVQLGQIQAVVEPLRNEREHLKTKLAERDITIKKLEESLVVRDSEQKQTNNQLAGAESNCMKLKQILEEEQGARKKKETETLALARERDQFHKKLVEQLEENDRLSTESRSLLRLSERIKHQLDGERFNKQEAFDSASNFLGENLRLKEEIIHLRTIMKQLKWDKRALHKKNNTELKEKLIIEQANSNRLVCEMTTLRVQLQQVEKQIQEFKSQMEHIRTADKQKFSISPITIESKASKTSNSIFQSAGRKHH